MFTYGTNFNIDDTMLLYPEHLHKTHENLILGVGENVIRLKLRSIDLFSNQPFKDYTNEIKDRLESLHAELSTNI